MIEVSKLLTPQGYIQPGIVCYGILNERKVNQRGRVYSTNKIMCVSFLVVGATLWTDGAVLTGYMPMLDANGREQKTLVGGISPYYLFATAEEALNAYYKDAGVVVRYDVFADPARQDSLWYGGDCVTVEYKGYRFIVSANGDVIGDLLKAQSDGSTPRNLEYVKDKGNKGEFGKMLRRYVDSDEHLSRILAYRDDEYSIELQNNNWWEVFVVDPQGQFHDLMCVLDSDKLFDAVKEVIEARDELIGECSAGNEGMKE